MTTYNGKAFTVAKPIREIYDMVADVKGYQALLDGKLAQAPDPVRSQIEDKLHGLRFEGGKIVLTAPGVGEVAFVPGANVAPTHAEFVAEGSPVPVAMFLELEDLGQEGTRLSPGVAIELPPMLKAMVGGKIQEAADMLGQMFTNLLK